MAYISHDSYHMWRIKQIYSVRDRTSKEGLLLSSFPKSENVVLYSDSFHKINLQGDKYSAKSAITWEALLGVAVRWLHIFTGLAWKGHIISIPRVRLELTMRYCTAVGLIQNFPKLNIQEKPSLVCSVHSLTGARSEKRSKSSHHSERPHFLRIGKE